MTSRQKVLIVMSDDEWYERERLHLAAQDGDLSLIKHLLAEGSDVNVFDNLGMTALHWAAKKEYLDVASFLIEAGTAVNARDELRIGDTALGEIAENCCSEMARLLVDAGADPRIRGWMQLNAPDRAKVRKRGDGPPVYALLVEAVRRKNT
jgi:ankyrin repeat protein